MVDADVDMHVYTSDTCDQNGTRPDEDQYISHRVDEQDP